VPARIPITSFVYPIAMFNEAYSAPPTAQNSATGDGADSCDVADRVCEMNPA